MAMKRIFNINIVVTLLFAMSFAACTVDTESYRSTESLAKTMWNTSKTHIQVVKNAVEDAVRISELLAIDDESEREQFLSTFFGRGLLSQNAKGYTITASTDYQTNYTWTIITNSSAFGAGEWRIIRSGGSSYDMILKPVGDAKFEAVIDRFYVNSHVGTANLTFSYEFDEENATTTGYSNIVGEYDGSIEVVDIAASELRPLYINTYITSTMTISDFNGIMSGKARVECIDKRYGSHDEINVTISYPPLRINIKCYNDYWTLYE